MEIEELNQVLEQVTQAVAAAQSTADQLYTPYASAQEKVKLLTETRNRILAIVATLKGIDEELIDSVRAASVGDDVSLQQALRFGTKSP